MLKRQRHNIRLWRKNKSFIYNLHPPHIPASGARFTYTFGLGGLAALTTLVAAATGLLLMFYYAPTVERAHVSLTFIDSVAAVSRETLFFREMIAALIAVAVLVFLSAYAYPALGPVADLSVAGQSDLKAPWFFLAIQELLRILPPLWAGWIIPLAGLALLGLIPFIDRQGPGRGEYFARTRWKPQVLFGGWVIVVVTLTVIAALR